MGRANMLICPNCDYKRYLTEAESLISYALVVACLKCGSPMQDRLSNVSAPSGKSESFRETLGVEVMEEWAVS